MRVRKKKAEDKNKKITYKMKKMAHFSDHTVENISCACRECCTKLRTNFVVYSNIIEFYLKFYKC